MINCGYSLIYKNFSTTKFIESVNLQIKKYYGSVTMWPNSNQRYKRMAAALLKIEPRLHKVQNYKNLEILKQKIKAHLNNSGKATWFQLRFGHTLRKILFLK